LKDLDSPSFENVYIIWNTELKNNSQRHLEEECQQVMEEAFKRESFSDMEIMIDSSPLGK